MEFRFCLQDPTDPQTTYLYEAIIQAIIDATSWQGIYAFASIKGVNTLIEDSAVRSFLDRGGELDLLVGIDAITNRSTLERLQEIERSNRQFRPKVFWNNEAAKLFHPKLSDFSYADGRRTLIVGSGNLTPGGLASNYEGYTIISASSDEQLDLSALDNFFQRHADHIRKIDEEVLEKAAQNVIRSGRTVKPSGILIPETNELAVEPEDILIAQVPRAGGRWSQAHFNAEVVRNYFCLTEFKKQRIFLTPISNEGTRLETEVRQCVYSQRNRNYKIEVGAASGQEYPDRPPLLVFRKRRVRVFDYMLLFPEDDGYEPLFRLTETLEKVGRGLPRVTASMHDLWAAWKSCPLLMSSEEEGFEQII